MTRSILLSILVAAALACPDEKNCLACSSKDNKSICAYCYLGWVDGEGRCVVLPLKERLDNCNLYNPKGKDAPSSCANCKVGFFSEEGKCNACKVPGCAMCDKADTCKACSNGKKLQLVPELKCLDAPSDVANCDVCDYIAPAHGCRCQLCKSGFALDPVAPDEKGCVEDKVGNCFILVRGDNSKCAYCAFGYYLGKDGKCWNNNREAWGWALWILLALVVVAIPLVWWCYKKRQQTESSHTQRMLN